MKKSNKIAAAGIWSIAFTLFHLLAFTIPTLKTPTFWIAYAFTTASFLFLIPVSIVSLQTAKKRNYQFLGISIFYIGICYLGLQLVAFLAFMLFPLLPPWAAITVSSLLLGITAICVILSKSGVYMAAHTEEKVNAKVQYITQLQTDIELLAVSCKDETIKTYLQHLAEKIQYSDPISNNQQKTAEMQMQMQILVEQLKGLNLTENTVEASNLLAQIDTLLTQRNKMTKILK